MDLTLSTRAGLEDMKTFEYEWIFEAFAEHPTFFTKRMFGGLAAYLFERQMQVLVEPTNPVAGSGTGFWSAPAMIIRRLFRLSSPR